MNQKLNLSQIFIILSIITVLLTFIADFSGFFYLQTIGKNLGGDQLYGIRGATMTTYDFLRFVIRDRVAPILLFLTYGLLFVYSCFKKNYVLLIVTLISLMDLLFIFGKVHTNFRIFHTLHMMTFFILTPLLYFIALIYDLIKKEYLLSISLFLIVIHSLSIFYAVVTST